jgi:hypothetical protein
LDRGSIVIEGDAKVEAGESRGHWVKYAKQKATIIMGLCTDLEGNIFGLGATMAANKMKTTQEKITQYVGMMK